MSDVTFFNATDICQIVRSKENHNKVIERQLWTFLQFSELNFKTVVFQLAWFSWLFDVSLVSRFIFCCGKPGQALIQPHTCACNMCIISSFVRNWQFRRIDHNGSQKPVSVRSPSSFTYNSHIKEKRKFSCLLDAHSQFLCSLASLKLSTVVVGHPNRIPSLLYWTIDEAFAQSYILQL